MCSVENLQGTEFLFSAHEVLRKERGLFEKYGNIQYNIINLLQEV